MPNTTARDTYKLTCSAQGLHGIREAFSQNDFENTGRESRDRGSRCWRRFGLKNFIYPEWVLLLWAARKLGRPIKWTGDRGEEFAAATQGRGIRAQARLALDADGKFLALDAAMVADLGAYLSGASPAASTRAALTAIGGGTPCRRSTRSLGGLYEHCCRSMRIVAPASPRRISLPSD